MSQKVQISLSSVNTWKVWFKRNREVILHVLIWGLFMTLPLRSFQDIEWINTEIYLTIYIHQLMLIVVFYLNYFVLTPQLLFKNKTGLFLLALAGIVFFNVFLHFLIKDFLAIDDLLSLRHNGEGIDQKIIKSEMMIFSSSILVLAIGTTLKSIQLSKMHEKMGQNIRESKLNAELAFLKNQISPHFFFNTLNTIYALIDSDSEAAKNSVHKLSKLMRYLLYETQQPLTTLEAEIGFLEDYIVLMKMRLPDHVHLEFEHQITNYQAAIPPMLLIPIIENAFKHGISHHQACNIRFSLLEKEDMLTFRSENPLFPSRKTSSDGVGLSNIIRRLEILYHGQPYDLAIDKERGTYLVTLTLPLYEDSLSRS